MLHENVLLLAWTKCSQAHITYLKIKRSDCTIRIVGSGSRSLSTPSLREISNCAILALWFKPRWYDFIILMQSLTVDQYPPFLLLLFVFVLNLFPAKSTIKRRRLTGLSYSKKVNRSLHAQHYARDATHTHFTRSETTVAVKSCNGPEHEEHECDVELSKATRTWLKHTYMFAMHV